MIDPSRAHGIVLPRLAGAVFSRDRLWHDLTWSHGIRSWWLDSIRLCDICIQIKLIFAPRISCHESPDRFGLRKSLVSARIVCLYAYISNTIEPLCTTTAHPRTPTLNMWSLCECVLYGCLVAKRRHIVPQSLHRIAIEAVGFGSIDSPRSVPRSEWWCWWYCETTWCENDEKTTDSHLIRFVFFFNFLLAWFSQFFRSLSINIRGISFIKLYINGRPRI